mgnify:FL=1
MGEDLSLTENLTKPVGEATRHMQDQELREQGKSPEVERLRAEAQKLRDMANQIESHPAEMTADIRSSVEYWREKAQAHETVANSLTRNEAIMALPPERPTQEVSTPDDLHAGPLAAI